ncbi:hypothetical protein, partial [Streptomyces chiangmaiensis]
MLDEQSRQFFDGLGVASSLHFAGELPVDTGEVQLAEDAALLARERLRSPGESCSSPHLEALSQQARRGRQVVSAARPPRALAAAF